MPPKSKLRKTVDEEALVTCASGPGLIREEVWKDETGAIVRYNLAFINHFMMPNDHGRVLGYDNAHGQHHRHFFGKVEAVSTGGFAEVAAVFYAEIEELKRRRL